MSIHGFLNRTLFIPYFDSRDGNDRLRHVHEIEEFNALGRDRLEDLQWRELKKTLEHAFENIPFYRKKYSEAGLSPDDIKTASDMTMLPTLTRDDIRACGEELLADAGDIDRLVKSATGGTISSPITIYLDPKCMHMRLAATIAFNKWFGYELGDKAAFLWGAEQDFPELFGLEKLKSQIRNVLTNRIEWMPTSYMDDSIMARYYQRLCSYRPAVIQAYPTPLYIFARYLSEKNLSYKPKTITVAAETLYDHQREQIESSFGIKVFNWYGSRELGHMASECKMHDGMHINAFHLFVETLSEGRQVFDSEGSLVVTDLRNRAMPLIRYEIGDVGVLSRRRCPCGSALPVLERVSGRLVDTFITRQGGRVPGVALTNRVIKDCRGIEQMQFIQKDFEHFKIRLVKGAAFTPQDVEALENAVSGYFGNQLQLEYEFVDSIPLTKSGKSRFCVCEIDEDANSASSYEAARPA